MSQGLKSQLQQLIKAKQYQAAIILLENSTLPDKALYIARIKLRMQEEAKAAESTPAPAASALAHRAGVAGCPAAAGVVVCDASGGCDVRGTGRPGKCAGAGRGGADVHDDDDGGRGHVRLN